MEPRKYQLDLVDYVTERNAIIYLPTGAGKTYVAIMAIQRYSQQLEKPIHQGGKRVIFMCNTVELARQQALEIKKVTKFKVGFYVGERDVDRWTAKAWNNEILDKQVLVGTSQVFLNIVLQNFIKITDLSLVIIDECHHGTKSHPMHEFMRMFLLADQSQLPRVIGLTGVLLKGNKLKTIQRDLEQLEATYRGNIVTVCSTEEFSNVMVYSAKPKEEIVSYRNEHSDNNLADRIKMEINALLSVVAKFDIGNIPTKLSKGLMEMQQPSKKKNITFFLNDFIFQMDNFGLYAASLAIMSPIVEFELKKRQAETMLLRQLYRVVLTKCDYIRHLLIKHMSQRGELMVYDDDTVTEPNPLNDDAIHTLDIIMRYSTPRMRALLLYIGSSFVGKQPDDISCLIFVDRRYTAKCIYYVIQKFVELTPGLANVLRPQFMVGRKSILPSIESTLDRLWNKKAIEAFRLKECNMIICSSVLEEGIDVQSCNYVFVVDPLKTFNSYIQTKGRARSTDSVYAVLTSKVDEYAVIQQIQGYKQVHEAIQKFLMNRILHRADPSDNAIAESFVDEIPIFQTASGATLIPSSALTLINRYCQQLPNDSFGYVAPRFSKHRNANNQLVVSCRLPLQSPLKETILSDSFANAKLLKVSAAFKACQKLYEIGELNEYLLPLSNRECLAKVADNHFKNWKKYDDDVTSSSKMGRQYFRSYDRLCPEELYNAMPVVGETCYAYEITIRPRFQSDDYTEHIIDMLDGKRNGKNYALLLGKRLPRLAEMPLFMNQGALAVKISDEPVTCCLDSDEELQQLRMFHLMIFRDLLRLWKTFLVMDGRNKEHSYLLVPLTAGNATGAGCNDGRKQIDWDLVRHFQHLLPHRNYSIKERQSTVYRPEDYLGKVVTKWYSASGEERFVVTAVRTDMSAQSPFENESGKTYADFTLTRFGTEVHSIVQPQVFLLEVRELTSRRNFFVNATGKGLRRDRKHNTIRLIPELCHNFMYPGDMWLKALFLPSILHRLNYMLHAETLRRRINQFLNVPLRDDYQPSPLTVDQSLRRVVDSDGNAMEETNSQKPSLPALPTKKTETHFTACPMQDSGIGWKEYLQPTDPGRNATTIFPIEVDYYYKFISRMVTELENLNLDENDEWTGNTHLTTQPRRAGYGADLRNINLPSMHLEDVPLENKRRIRILERSFARDGNEAIQSTTGEQAEFLAAITTSKANDVFDMERFEILGDSFLKFASSLYLVNKYPNWHEGLLTQLKSRLVSNRNLLYCMLDHDIPNRICTTLFSPHAVWMPPLASLPLEILEALNENSALIRGITPRALYSLQLSDANIMSGCVDKVQLSTFVANCTRHLAAVDSVALCYQDDDTTGFLHKSVMVDKVIADTLEALLGVCVKNYGIHSAFRMLEFFGIIRADSKEEPLSNLLNLQLGSFQLRANITVDDVDGFLINHSHLEENLGYKFRDRSYLLQALTHPSYPTNRITGCYQELEFIGDAILDFLVSCYIFEQYEHMTPGKVTDLRSALVNNITLACVCVRYRYHLFLLYENSVLSESIKNFADFQETQGHIVTDQVRILMEEDNCMVMSQGKKHGNSSEPKFNIAVNVDVPKALGDLVEALIAAVYLDCRDLFITWNVIYRMLKPEIDAFADRIPLDSVRELNEHKTAKAKFSEPIAEDDVVMVKCQFVCFEKCVEVNGFGANSKQAKKSAAKHALQILAKNSN